MKMFKVTVDNNPGGWKSGEDPSTLVLALDKEDAIQKVKDGWWSTFQWETDKDGNRNYFTIYKQKGDHSYIRDDSQFSVTEILFELDGYEVEIFNVRKKKLEQIKEIENDTNKDWSPI